MKLKLFQVDAFSEKLFGGNPAAVIPLETWLPDELMQKIAGENNISETAFYVPKGDGFELRWFTPAVEVPLCGHATLATAHVMYTHLGYSESQINFNSKSGMLSVRRRGELLVLDFPKDELNKIEIPETISKAISAVPSEVYRGRNMLLVLLNSQEEIEALDPDIELIKESHSHGVVFSAKGIETDFVSRCFFPNSGINEDPATGSAHCILTPYWSAKLGKTKLTARQLSQRIGNLTCELIGDRVEISGKAITYLQGEIEI